MRSVTRFRRGARREARPGFSLLEVLIVVSILAIVVGGVYGLYETSMDNASLQQMNANRKALKIAIDQYKARTGRFPNSLEALTRGYLNRVPDDPTTAFTGNDWL